MEFIKRREEDYLILYIRDWTHEDFLRVEDFLVKHIKERGYFIAVRQNREKNVADKIESYKRNLF